MQKKSAEEKREKQTRSPSLEIDYVNQRIFINDKLQDISPADGPVGQDIDSWMEYLSGLDEFTGDTDRLKQTAWMILNYVFVSPFLAEQAMAYLSKATWKIILAASLYSMMLRHRKTA